MDKSSNPHEGFLLCIQQKIIYILFTEFKCNPNACSLDMNEMNRLIAM